MALFSRTTASWITELKSSDGRYWAEKQGDGNFVVYDTVSGSPVAVWDRWSYEAMQPSPSSPTPLPPDPGVPLPADPPRPSPASGPGGFVVPCAEASTRPLLTAGDVAAWLPTSRGAFTFPPPYGTQGVRVTDASDGAVLPVGYSYWRRINMHRDRNELRVLVSRRDDYARLVIVDKATLACRVEDLADVWGTGEMWYWDAVDPDSFWLLEGGALLRYNVVTRSRTSVMNPGGDFNLWQPSSDASGTKHAASVEQIPSYEVVHALVGTADWQRIIPIGAGYDEAQIDKSGRWLLMKQGPGGADNYIEDLDGHINPAILTNAEGAAGHSDNGPGYMVGENDYHAQPGAFELRWFDRLGSPTLVYHTTDWNAPIGMARHIGIAWDRPDPVAVISSCARNNVPRANEIVIVDLAGSLQAHVIAPNLVDLDGPGSDDYSKTPKANIDPMGEWVCWSGNVHGRTDLFLVKVPA